MGYVKLLEAGIVLSAIATRYGFVTVRFLSPVRGKGYSKRSNEL